MKVTGEAVRIRAEESMEDAIARAAAKYTNKSTKEATALALPLGTNASDFVDGGWLVSIYACQPGHVLVGEPIPYDDEPKPLML